MEPSMAAIYLSYGYAQYGTCPPPPGSHSPTMQSFHGFQQYPHNSCSYYQYPSPYGIDFESTRMRLIGRFSVVETLHSPSPPLAPSVCTMLENDPTLSNQSEMVLISVTKVTNTGTKDVASPPRF